MNLFELPEEPDTWRNHAWWTCTDSACKWCHTPEARETAAMQASNGWDLQALAWIQAQPAGLVFTADDLTAAVGPSESSGATGAVFRKAQKSQLIRSCGYVKAQRVTSHGRVLQQWLKI